MSKLVMSVLYFCRLLEHSYLGGPINFFLFGIFLMKVIIKNKETYKVCIFTELTTIKN